MLTNEEKKEMLEDARSDARRKAFAVCANQRQRAVSFDDYFSFLEDIQEIFGPFPISTKISPTANYKL